MFDLVADIEIGLLSKIDGAWRSLVAHYTGGVGVVGSNPIAPTNETRREHRFLAGFPFRNSTSLNANKHRNTLICLKELGKIWAVVPFLFFNGIAMSGNAFFSVWAPSPRLTKDCRKQPTYHTETL